MKKEFRSLGLLFLGLSLGGVIGVLAAPTKGLAVRHTLMYSLKLYQKKLRAFIAKLTSNKNNVGNYAKDLGKVVITDMVHAAEKILKELDDLSRQLEEKEG
ncbi:MAG: hypothetical protein K2X94_00950 [Amoebophilaceae bacterium]|nr:hypothetical protein [Amoebophilaceae bacterium]